MEGFLTPRALARVSGWPEKRIRELIAAKELRHIRLKSRYFIPQGALDEFVARNGRAHDEPFVLCSLRCAACA